MEKEYVWVVHQSGYENDHIVAFCKTEERAKELHGKYNTVHEPAYITSHELQ